MTILFTDTLQQLFTQLGLAYTEEVGVDTYPALVLDEQMIVHFVEREDRIEMITSLGGLPSHREVLAKLLMLNYSEAPFPLCFASDVEGNDLLAIIRLPPASDANMLFIALQSLVLQIETSKIELAETRHLDQMAEPLQILV